MIFAQTPIAGLWTLTPTRAADARGSFERAFCRHAFARHGIDFDIAQCSLSHTRLAGTVRGLHLQVAPHAEAKIVRCLKGRVFDVVADLRSGSPTRGRWHGVELDAAQGTTVYLAPGLAHGFQTLTDEVDILYAMSAPYAAQAAFGVRYDDPDLAVTWPLAVTQVSPADQVWPPLATAIEAVRQAAAHPSRNGADSPRRHAC